MTEASLGAARLDIEVDLTQLEVAVKTAKSRLADMSADAQAQYQQLNKAEKRRVDTLISQADTLAFTKAQQLAYNAALKTSGPVLDELTRKIAENEAKARSAGIQLNQYGLSAKQTAAALRGVPAQVTDIFTSLASGQNPLTVVLQQGGQLKDMFGGAVPAARALGSAVVGLINPLTVSAAAAATLGVAYYQAQQEAFAFDKAIILSGNAATQTASQLQAAAVRLDGFAGTQRNASAVLAQITSTGRVSAGEMENAAKTAIQLQRVAGIAVEETIGNLVALGKDPVEASKRLNEQYHYLSASTLNRIKELEKEGDAAGAAALAQRSFADAGLARANELEKHLGTLPKLARDVKDAAGEMWDGLMGLGRKETPETALADIEERLRQIRSGESTASERTLRALEKRRAQLAADPQVVQSTWWGAQLAAGNAAAENASRALDKWDRITESNLSKRAKLEKEILEIRRAGVLAGKSEVEITEQIAAARAKDAGTKQAKVNADDNSAKTLIESIDRQIQANYLLTESGEKVTASDRLGITARQSLADSTNTMTDATRALLVATLPMLDASDKAAELAQNEAKAKEALARQNGILTQQTRNRRDANDADLFGMSHGKEAEERLQRLNAINRQYEETLREIGDRSVADDKMLWDQRVENARVNLRLMLRDEEDYQRQLARLRGDYRTGVKAALEDYLADASDTARQTYDVISNGLKRAEDAWVKFVQTGKLSFRDLANSIIADLSRIAGQRLIASLLGPILGRVNTSMGANAATLPGFANGGSFTVGGNGGTDSQLVAFRATPGEKVSIEPPFKSMFSFIKPRWTGENEKEQLTCRRSSLPTTSRAPLWRPTPSLPLIPI